MGGFDARRVWAREHAMDAGAGGTASGEGSSGRRAPLAGIRVADFSRILAGPYATMTLADFGADVVKIESPAGDDTRNWRPPVDARGQATYFAGVNRNKRSIALDLRDPDDLDVARALAATADVVIENFRPGVMAGFGLDHDSVREVNPGVVYASITGFGSGAGASRPGFDLLVQAVGGLMSITGPADGAPSKAGVALVDVITGQNAVAGILLALRERDESGLGQRVEVDLMTSLLSALANQASSTLATGRAPGRLGNAHPSISPYELYRAADRDLVIAVGNDRQFGQLAGILGLPGLAEDERFATNPARVANRDALRGILDGALAARPAAEWISLLDAARVPAGLVNDVREAFELAEALGLDPVVELADDEGRVSRQTANPVRLGATPATYRLAPPELPDRFRP